MSVKEKYILYIDECGDQNLVAIDPNFPIFTLCGILMPVKKVNALKYDIDQLKMDFWGHTDVILHSRDIRKCQKHFKIFLEDTVKHRFYSRINEILACQDVYVIVCCSVRKSDCIEECGTDADIYGVALKYVLQRSIFCVDDKGGGEIRIVVERRGKREDTALLKYFNELKVSGMHYVNPDRFSAHIADFSFSAKSENVFGLQLADLIAYPLSRHVINPENDNPAFDVIAPNIYSCDGKMLGLKIFPR